MLHGAIEAELATPPATPSDGQCWLVATGASGDWTGQAGRIAARQSGNWLFIAPRDGMRLLNRTSGQEIRFQSTWKHPPRPATPTGGTVIDSEARSTISNLVAALVEAGILPA